MKKKGLIASIGILGLLALGATILTSCDSSSSSSANTLTQNSNTGSKADDASPSGTRDGGEW